MKVMLVEDDELVRATLAEGLEDAGLQVRNSPIPRRRFVPLSQPNLPMW